MPAQAGAARCGHTRLDSKLYPALLQLVAGGGDHRLGAGGRERGGGGLEESSRDDPVDVLAGARVQLVEHMMTKY